MRTYYKGLIIAFSVSFIMACQTTNITPPAFPLILSSDATTTAAIQEELKQNHMLTALPIQVETTKGVVILRGYVKTIRQSDTAEAIARKTAGVKSVENNLVVRK